MGNLVTKVYFSVLAFSVLLFSNYTGNDAQFSNVNSRTIGDNIVFSTFFTLNTFFTFNTFVICRLAGNDIDCGSPPR